VSKLPLLIRLDEAMEPAFLLSINDDVFNISVQCRAPKAALELTGSITPYAEGSLMRGRVRGSQYTSVVAAVLAILLLLALLASAAGYSSPRAANASQFGM
jgi:hypothetical protein